MRQIADAVQKGLQLIVYNMIAVKLFLDIEVLQQLKSPISSTDYWLYEIHF